MAAFLSPNDRGVFASLSGDSSAPNHGWYWKLPPPVKADSWDWPWIRILPRIILSMSPIPTEVRTENYKTGLFACAKIAGRVKEASTEFLSTMPLTPTITMADGSNSAPTESSIGQWATHRQPVSRRILNRLTLKTSHRIPLVP